MSGLVIDNFAGGGGASTGIEAALARPVDISINHDAKAVAMHAANHPWSRHLCESVFAVDPQTVCGGQTVDLAWFSPDCTHHSRAKGGKPRKKNIRGLAWVVLRWARYRARVIILENVQEFEDWGPLTREGQPCPVRKGKTFKFWVEQLRRHGYSVEWRLLRACDYGTPTIRRRLFLIARCDGKPIVWPKPTHGLNLKPYHTAAGIIDWSIPCPSIFLTKEEGRALGVKRPLADATLRRIARGVQRYVIDAAEPFFITFAQHGGGNRSAGNPLHTVAASTKDQNCVVAPTLIQTGYSERPGQSPRVPGLDKPLGTVVAGGAKHALVAAFLAQHNTGMVGHDARKPISTITERGTQQQIVASTLVHLRNNSSARDVRAPVQTLTAGGGHIGEVRAFLTKYYGSGGQWSSCAEPMHTVRTRDSMGLVTVQVAGEEYVIADIGMRMLNARELYRAQGFPDSYIIDAQVDGKPLTKSDQIRMCGNSVCPDVAAAVVRANLPADKRPDIPLFGEWRAAAE